MKPVVSDALLLAATLLALSQETRTLQPRVAPETVTVGDLVTYSVDVPLAAGEAIAGPGPEASFGVWEVRGYSVQPSVGKATLTYTLAAFQTGKLQVPSITISIAGSDGKIRQVRTSAVSVTVASVLDEKDEQPADIVGPLALRESPTTVALRLLLAALLAFGLGVAGWLLWKHRRRRIAERDRCGDTPDAIALRALAALRAARLPDSGQVKHHYSELSEIVRTYVAARWGLRTLEETTRRIVAQMQNHPACAEYAPIVEDLLSEADLVKFAKARPQPAACWSALDAAERFVRITAQRTAAPESRSPEHAPEQEEARGTL